MSPLPSVGLARLLRAGTGGGGSGGVGSGMPQGIGTDIERLAGAPGRGLTGIRTAYVVGL